MVEPQGTAEIMDTVAMRVADCRFNIVVIKSGMVQWLRELNDSTDDQDIKDRCDCFIKLLQKGMQRDTGRVQRRSR